MDAFDDRGELVEDLVGALVVLHLGGDELGARKRELVPCNMGLKGCLQIAKRLWCIEDLIICQH